MQRWLSLGCDWRPHLPVVPPAPHLLSRTAKQLPANIEHRPRRGWFMPILSNSLELSNSVPVHAFDVSGLCFCISLVFSFNGFLLQRGWQLNFNWFAEQFVVLSLRALPLLSYVVLALRSQHLFSIFVFFILGVLVVLSLRVLFMLSYIVFSFISQDMFMLFV